MSGGPFLGHEAGFSVGRVSWRGWGDKNGHMIGCFDLGFGMGV
jgi:hypothetical protein